MTIDATLYENTIIRCRLLTERLRIIANDDTQNPDMLKAMAAEILTWGPDEAALLKQLQEVQHALYQS